MVDTVMGYPPGDPLYAQAVQILQAHYDAPRRWRQPEPPRHATPLRSTFALACESPTSLSLVSKRRMTMTMLKRRDGLLAALFGAGHIGLRALATGLPAWFLAEPAPRDRAGSAVRDRRAATTCST